MSVAANNRALERLIWALDMTLGFIGSVVFGLTGTVAWWQSRQSTDEDHWWWLAGAGLAAAPAVLLVCYQLVHL